MYKCMKKSCHVATHSFYAAVDCLLGGIENNLFTQSSGIRNGIRK